MTDRDAERFAQLQATSFLEPVVEANRIYLSLRSTTRACHNHALADAILGIGASRPIGVAYQARNATDPPAPPTPPGPVDPDCVGAGLLAHNRLQNRLADHAAALGLSPRALGRARRPGRDRPGLAR